MDAFIVKEKKCTVSSGLHPLGTQRVSGKKFSFLQQICKVSWVAKLSHFHYKTDTEPRTPYAGNSSKDLSTP